MKIILDFVIIKYGLIIFYGAKLALSILSFSLPAKGALRALLVIVGILKTPLLSFSSSFATLEKAFHKEKEYPEYNFNSYDREEKNVKQEAQKTEKKSYSGIDWTKQDRPNVPITKSKAIPISSIIGTLICGFLSLLFLLAGVIVKEFFTLFLSLIFGIAAIGYFNSRKTSQVRKAYKKVNYGDTIENVRSLFKGIKVKDSGFNKRGEYVLIYKVGGNIGKDYELAQFVFSDDGKVIDMGQAYQRTTHTTYYQ